jgi:hypothetical protein
MLGGDDHPLPADRGWRKQDGMSALDRSQYASRRSGSSWQPD